MKFIFGVAIGYFLFHPYNENNKLDRATSKVIERGSTKLAEFLIEKFEKVMGS